MVIFMHPTPNGGGVRSVLSRWIVPVLPVMFFGARAESQVTPRDAKITVSNGTALLTFPDFSGIPVNLKFLSGAAVIKEADVLFEHESGEIFYVVVRLNGPTLKNGGSRHCGAGEETNLVWIKASHAAVLDVRSILYNSCAFSIEPLDLPEATSRGLHVEYVSYSEGRKFRCTYDHRSPANGLLVTSQAMARGRGRKSSWQHNGDWYYVVE